VRSPSSAENNFPVPFTWAENTARIMDSENIMVEKDWGDKNGLRSSPCGWMITGHQPDWP
jgi:hypothetical protein